MSVTSAAAEAAGPVIAVAACLARRTGPDGCTTTTACSDADLSAVAVWALALEAAYDWRGPGAATEARATLRGAVAAELASIAPISARGAARLLDGDDNPPAGSWGARFGAELRRLADAGPETLSEMIAAERAPAR